MDESMTDLYYFAHPYSCKNPDGTPNHAKEEANFNLCCQRSAELILAGYNIYSPICHSHPIHISRREFIEANEYKKWIDLDNLIIEKTDFKGIILAPGWASSMGCIAEYEKFVEKCKVVMMFRDAINTARNLLDINAVLW